MNHSLTRQIVKLISQIVKLGIVKLEYFGVYTKDQIDDVLLLSHRGSSYKGKSREIERTAVSEYIKWLTSHYRVEKDTSKEIEKELINEREWKDDFPYEYTDDDMIRGDQFPIYNQYISHK
jgi:hypothetical protein